MIFVTLGNVPIPFIRLAKKIDELAGGIKEEVVVQHGHTQYPFKNVKAHQFLSSNEMERHIDDASLIITHGGYGTISECLKKNKKVIAVPRLAGEHNHSQEELVRALESEGYLIGVYDINDLEKAIEKTRTFAPVPVRRGNAVKVLNDFIKASIET